MKQVYKRPKYLTKAHFHYCPGCGHSIVHRLICELMDEMKIQDRAIGVPPPGCSVFAYNYIDTDFVESAHGRGAAVATGIKRAAPETVVFTYQGDGDISAIGTGETIHAANRGERITSIFINNAVYGMTGGQMAPTTLLTQKTTTSPYGRDKDIEGYPIKLSEMLALTEGSVYIERTAVNSPKNITKTKKALKKAFQVQLDDQGYSLVEILSPCPTNWKMSTLDSWKWVDEAMTDVFPLGVIKDKTSRKKG